jgi:hypothetical protein
MLGASLVKSLHFQKIRKPIEEHPEARYDGLKRGNRIAVGDCGCLGSDRGTTEKVNVAVWFASSSIHSPSFSL